MGGISVGGPVELDEGVVRFAGLLSLENNGGFSSIRAESDSFALEPGKEIVLTVMGDGRSYNFDFRTSRRQRSFTYRQTFQTKVGEETKVRLPLAGFEATRFGRKMRNASPLNPAEITSIGFTLSDGKPGPFRLDVLRIETDDPSPMQAGTVEDLLQLAIQKGVPLYNRGDMDACASVYEMTLMSLLMMPEGMLPGSSRKMVESTLMAAQQTHNADEKAWALRRGMDALMRE
jgi:monofunctional biosynthetic peptidoglycan transglycosylase